MNPLIGKTIQAVFLAEDSQAIKFDLKDGDSIIALADGDCCSYTWIEYVETPKNLLGVVKKVEDIDMPDLGNMDGSCVVAYYGCKITTDKGTCLLDYRNDSNGYYGGYLSWPGKHFYGGVFGQNVSQQVWKQIA